MTELIVVLGVVMGAPCVIFLLEKVAQVPTVVAAVILLHVAADTIFRLDDPVVSLGSITVYLGDVIYGLIAGGAFVRLLGLRRLSFGQITLLGLAGLALFSVTRGALTDVAPALNDFRRVMYILSAALYFVTVDPTREFLERTTLFVYVSALLMLGGAIALWGALLGGASLPGFFAPPYEGGFRVITADRGIVIAQACLLALPAMRLRHTGKHLFERLLIYMLIPAILLLQHRTVWILFIVGLAIAAARDLGLSRRMLVPVVATAAAAILLLSILFARGDAPALDQALETQSTSAETLLWRIEGWQALLNENGPESASEVLLGSPYGRGYERIVGETEVTSQAHSFYIDNYLRHGILGLSVLILLYVWLIRGLSAVRPQHARSGLSNSNMLLALVATQLVFFITYTPSPEQGLVLGIALSVAMRSRSGSTRADEGVSGLAIHEPIPNSGSTDGRQDKGVYARY